MYSVIALATHIIGSLHAAAQSGASAGGDTTTPRQPLVRQIKVDGDLVIGGLFPVHARGADAAPCGAIMEGRGVHRVEAMLFALDQLNADARLLPGIRLGAHIVDSCSTPAYALNQSLDFVRELIGLDAAQYECDDASAPRPREQTQPVVGVIGGSYSSVTIQVANLLRLFHIVQISPASTNADLSDKERFEYFARTVPSDNFQAQAMADMATHYGWKWVSLVYSAGDYGELGANAFKKEAYHQKICTFTIERIGKDTDMDEVIGRLISGAAGKTSGAGAKVVVMFTRNDDVQRVLAAADKRRAEVAQNGIIWLASEGWDMRAETTAGREQVAEGALVLKLDSYRVPEFERYFLSLNPRHDKFARNEWLKEFWEWRFKCAVEPSRNSTLPACADDLSLADSFNPDNKVQFVIDAVYAIAYALDTLYRDACADEHLADWPTDTTPAPQHCHQLRHIDGTQLYQTYLLNVSFTNIVNRKFRFDEHGDGPAYYQILNYQQMEDGSYDYVPVGLWHDTRLSIDDSLLKWRGAAANSSAPASVCSWPCQVGQIKRFTGGLSAEEHLCCWVCVSCKDYQFTPNETYCEDCELGMWPYANRSDCHHLDILLMRFGSLYAIIPIALSAIGILLSLQVIVVYIKYSSTPIIKASGRELSYILLIAIICCYGLTFLLLAKPSPVICGLRRVGVGVTFAVLYSALLVKTNRIYRIFSSARRSAARPSCVRPLSQVALVAAAAAPNLLGALVWLAVVPPRTRFDYPTRDRRVLSCAVADYWFATSLAYDALLIVLCTVFAVKTRQVPENYNETKFIGFTMYTTCIIWLAFVPIYFGTGSDFQVQTTTLCVSISLSATVVLFCIFSPKVWVVLVEPENNVHKPERMVKMRSATAEMMMQLAAANPLLNSAVASRQDTTPSKKPLLNNGRHARSSRASPIHLEVPEMHEREVQQRKAPKRDSYKSIDSLTSL